MDLYSLLGSGLLLAFMVKKKKKSDLDMAIIFLLMYSGINSLSTKREETGTISTIAGILGLSKYAGAL